MIVRMICALILTLGISSLLNAPKLSFNIALAETGQVADTASKPKKKSEEQKSVVELAAETDLPATLSPDLFTGEVRDGYIIAQTIPAVLAELHCYCGCDKSVGHGNLLDCFVDSHAAG